MKSVRRVRGGLDWAQGLISPRQIEALAQRFRRASAGATRVIVVHHPLLMPERRMRKAQRRVDNADRALSAFAALGVRLVLSGHFHLSYVRRFEQPGTVREGVPSGLREAAAAPVLVAQSASTTSTRLRGEPNAYNVIDIVGDEIAIAVREWDGGGWQTRETAAKPLP